MELINIKINDRELLVPKDMTILEAAGKININLPTLCYLKEIGAISSCRICVVELKGARTLVSACSTVVAENMEIYTHSPKVQAARRETLELILSNHQKDCLSCIRNQNCELQKLADDFMIDTHQYPNIKHDYIKDESTSYIVRDNAKCILCRRCVAVCNKIQDISVISPIHRGINTEIGCAFEKDLKSSKCIACGQCINVCPTNALSEKDDTKLLWEKLNDPTLHVVIATAPSIRVGLGEEFNLPIGTNVKGKMVSAIRRLGFKNIYDINFGADLTIMEEATEFLERLESNENLPLITSCCPGWVTYAESYLPSVVPHLSSCKSPQQMFGSIIKTYYAKKNNLDAKKIFVVGVMPCVAKKHEITRKHQNVSVDYPDVDLVITTRELARMIKQVGIDFNNLPDEDFDDAFGTGASVVFGASGGVMESALRTVADWVNKESLTKLEYEEVRGIKGIKAASYNIGGKEVRVAVASGIANAKKLFEHIKNKECDFHFIEIMACPGGCINGGGQPIQPAIVRNNQDLKSLRIKTIYKEDKSLPIRKAHENPIIKELYKNYLTKPGSNLAHDILHVNKESKNLN